MSSELRRGAAVPTERLSWQRGSSPEADDVFPEQGTAGTVYADLSQSAPDAGHFRQIRRQGFEEGQAAAGKAYAAQLEAMQVKLARTIEEITSLRPRFRQEAERDVVALALAIARRILHRELTVDPEALLGVVKAALARMDVQEANQVRVSPQDAAMVQAFFQKMGIPRKIEIISDTGLAPGSVILESDRGALDASVDTQIDEIERGFADLVRRGP